MLIFSVYFLGMAALWASKPSLIRWRGMFLKLWARAVARIIGMRITTQGASPVNPFFLVSNHLSYLDIVLLFTRLPGVFVSRADLKGWPLIGPLARSLNTLFIDRAKKMDVFRVNGQIKEIMASGYGIIIFPEGTTTGGDRVLTFKPSLLELAVKQNCPVSYASISYKTLPGEISADRSVCWWNRMPFSSHIFNLLKMPEFQATLIFGEKPIYGTDRKTLAKELWDAVNQQFIPVIPGSKTPPA